MDGAFPPIGHQFPDFLFVAGGSGGLADLLAVHPQHDAQVVATTDRAGVLRGLTVIMTGGDKEEVSIADSLPGHLSLPELPEHMPPGPLVTDLISIIHHTGKCRPGRGERKRNERQTIIIRNGVPAPQGNRGKSTVKLL